MRQLRRRDARAGPAPAADAWPRRLRDAALTLVVTLLVAVVSWRVAVVTDSPLALAALFAAPVALIARGTGQSLFSLLAVVMVGAALLRQQPGWAAHTAAFCFAGAVVMAGALLAGLYASARLRDSQAQHAMLRSRLKREARALNDGGVCLVVVGRNLAWLSASEAAWTAFGADLGLRGEQPAELDDEAASALMHSSSRESWRRLLENVKADFSGSAPRKERSAASKPYLVTLYNQAGEPLLHRFTVTRGESGEMVFLGVPLHSESQSAQETGATLEQWLQAVALSLDEPAAILQADGLLLATNPRFDSLAGTRPPNARIFDCPGVEGLDERAFAQRVWSPTRRGSAPLPWLRLAGMEGLGARLVPPGAPHVEAVLLVFRRRGSPVSPTFDEHTRPMEH